MAKEKQDEEREEASVQLVTQDILTNAKLDLVLRNQELIFKNQNDVLIKLNEILSLAKEEVKEE